MKVVIGGSRAITHLNPEVRNWIQKICNSGGKILVGDANGADKAVQKFLHEIAYQSVTIYCMDTGCRNNIGAWFSQKVSSNHDKNSFEYFSSKDREMARQADFGFMIWDSKSKGSLSNMIYLLQLQKECLVYFSPEHNLVNLKSSSDLARLLSKCSKDSLIEFERKLSLSREIKKINSLAYKQATFDFLA